MNEKTLVEKTMKKVTIVIIVFCIVFFSSLLVFLFHMNSLNVPIRITQSSNGFYIERKSDLISWNTVEGPLSTLQEAQEKAKWWRNQDEKQRAKKIVVEEL